MNALAMLRGVCLALASLAAAGSALATPGNVVISQIWGGPSATAGTAGQPRADYVELFNRTTSPISISGWALNISTSTGTAWVKLDLPAVSIPARSYYLVRVSADATNGTNISPDAAFSTLSFTTLSSTSGKVLLRDTTAAIGTDACPTANIVDLVTYSTGTVTCFEGSGKAPGGGTTGSGLAVFRLVDGCLDTDDNANDFATRIPNPRNLSSSAAATCDSGACCNLNTGACVTDSATGCAGAGLSYTTDGTACASLPCPATGACCPSTTSTTCTILTALGCASNFYIGDGVACSPNPCSASTSCCFPNGTCCTMAAHLCSAQSGTPGAYAIVCTAAGTCVQVPSNDLCSGALPLTPGVYREGNNANATFTGDGPIAPCLSSINASSHGVWYTFTPAATSTYEISSCGTAINSDLAVFTIPNCSNPDSWTIIGCDDQACPSASGTFYCGATVQAVVAARISGIPLQAGITYYIRLSLNGTGNGGNHRIIVNDLGAAASGACCYATNGRCDVRTEASCTDAEVVPNGSYQGDNSVCTPTLCGTGYGACCNAGACQMRLVGTCTGTGVFFVEDTACNPTPCVLDPLPPNGTCATAAVLLDSDFPFSSLLGINQAPDGPAVSCTNSAATVTHNAVWYSYMPTADCVLSAWEVGSRDTTVVVYDNGVAAPACDSNNWTTVLCETEETDANVPLTAGHLYYILVATPSTASTSVNDFYSLKFKIVVPTFPSNGSCALVAAITPSTSFQSFPGGGAAPGPRSQCQTLSYQPQEARNAIWFTYTTPPNLDQVVRMQRILNSNNNIFFSLAFFTGDCNGLNPYECASLGTADQFIRLHRNTTYYIMAHKRSGYLAGDGLYQFLFDVLTPGQAPNQDCATATVIPGLPYADSVNNILAFDETPVTGGNCSGNSVQNASGIWYSFSPAQATVVTITETSAQNAAMSVFENSCTSNKILCTALEDESGVPGANTFRAYPGNTYYILVAREATGLPALTDTLNLNVTGITVPQPLNDDCTSATPIPSLPFSETTAIGTARDDTPRAVCSRGTITSTSRNGIWYTYTNGFGAAAVVMAETSGLDSIIAAYKGECGELIPVMCTDEPESNVYLYMESFTTYHIFVAKASDTPAAASDVLSFTIQQAPSVIPPPLNQYCTQAQLIRSLPFSYSGLPLAAANGPVSSCANQPVSLTCVQSTNPLWYAIDGGSSGFTVRIAETSSNDVTYSLFQDCGGFEQGCNTGDGTPTVPILFTLNPGTRYYLQIARQTNSDYAYVATPYALSISAADGTPGACCNGAACTVSVIESCASRFIPGGVCDPINPVACCPANFNQTGGVQIQDIFDFLNAWFAGATSADFNANGTLEVQDIFDFLNAWFVSC